jgi:hypothetical protein
MIYLDMADLEIAHICLVIEYGNTFKKRILQFCLGPLVLLLQNTIVKLFGFAVFDFYRAL